MIVVNDLLIRLIYLSLGIFICIKELRREEAQICPTITEDFEEKSGGKLKNCWNL